MGVTAPLTRTRKGGAEAAVDDVASDQRTSVCVIGSGPHFLSGISYYTNRLINELGRKHRVSAILMRTLLPKRLYPGRERVGKELTRFSYPRDAAAFDGVDWWWGSSMFKAVRLLRRERPRVVVFQWWSGTVLHSFLLLAAVARLGGAKLVLEFHEVLDTAEADMPAARIYVKALMPLLLRMTDGFVVHNEHDRAALEETYGLGDRPVAIVPHGPYDQYVGSTPPVVPETEEDVFTLLYFGVIRPFKGVEDLVAAFDSLSDEEAARYRLKVVGETWEGCTQPGEMIAASRHRDRIDFVNYYVDDDQVAALFAEADAAVLPYHRSSSSGPLQLAMSSGLPVIVTAVGGLVEAVADYEGAIQVQPAEPGEIATAIREVVSMRGTRFEDAHSWDNSLAGFDHLFERIGVEEDS